MVAQKTVWYMRRVRWMRDYALPFLLLSFPDGERLLRIELLGEMRLFFSRFFWDSYRTSSSVSVSLCIKLVLQYLPLSGERTGTKGQWKCCAISSKELGPNSLGYARKSLSSSGLSNMAYFTFLLLAALLLLNVREGKKKKSKTDEKATALLHWFLNLCPGYQVHTFWHSSSSNTASTQVPKRTLPRAGREWHTANSSLRMYHHKEENNGKRHPPFHIH